MSEIREEVPESTVAQDPEIEIVLGNESGIEDYMDGGEVEPQADETVTDESNPLQETIAALQAQVQQLQQAPQNTSGTSELVAALRAAQQPVAAPQEDWTELKKRYADQIIDDPGEVIEDLTKRILQSTEQKFSQLAAQNKKLEMLTNRDTKEFYDRYKDEIETKMGQFGTDPNAFEKAIQETRVLHFDDEVKIQTQKELEKRLAEIQGGGQTTYTGVGKIERGSGNAAPKMKRRVTLTPEQLREMEASPFSQEAFIEKLKAEGRLGGGR
jgi:hypothetical protein